MGLISIEIPSWTKFNPRSDRSNYSWFRFQNDFFADQVVFTLSGDEQRVFIFVLCEASKKNSGKIVISPDYVAAILRIKPSQFMESLTALEHAGLVTAKNCALPAQSRHDAGKEPANGRPTNDTYETDDTNETIRDDTHENAQALASAPPLPDLVSVWNENCGTLPKIEQLTAIRLKHWKKRWADKPDQDYWKAQVTRLAESRFCNGENDRGWRASADFLLRPDTHVKIAEGQYDAMKGARRPTYAENNETSLKELWERVEAGQA